MRSGVVVTLVVLGVLVLGVVWLVLRPYGEADAPTDTAIERSEPPSPEPPPPASLEPPVLIGRPVPQRPVEPTPEVRARLAERERALEQALRLHEAGVVSSQDVDRARLDLAEARYAAGEIDERELHTLRAELFETELRQLESLHEAGVVPQIEVERARVAVAYERYRAGGPRPLYAAAWRAFREKLRTRDEALVGAGALPAGRVEEDLRAFEAQFPDPDGPADR